MIRPTPEHGDIDLIPQAVLWFSVSSLAKRYRVVEGEDDLDYYEGASFILDDRWPFAIRHYRGHPEGTTTIYLDANVREVGRIQQLIARIVRELDLPPKVVSWQRGDALEIGSSQDGFTQ